MNERAAGGAGWSLLHAGRVYIMYMDDLQSGYEANTR